MCELFDIFNWRNIFWKKEAQPVTGNTVNLIYSHGSPYFEFDSSGPVRVRYYQAGVEKTEDYAGAGEYYEFSEAADANTILTIEGDITNLYLAREGFIGPIYVQAEEHETLEKIEAQGCPISTFDVHNCAAFGKLVMANNTYIATLDLRDNPAFYDLNIQGCSSLFELYLPTTTEIIVSDIVASACPNIRMIYAPKVTGVATVAIASMITNSLHTDGTVYATAADASYYQISTAATSKGWTIENL